MTVRRRLLIDLDPLRGGRDFRLLFAGQLVSMMGTQLTAVAVPFEVYSLTRSSLQVGAVSLAQLVPLIVGALAGGALGDSHDRRALLRVAPLLVAVTSAGLALNATGPHPSVLAVYLLSAAGAAFGGAFSAAAASAVPFLVDPEHLLGAFASMQVVDQVGMVLGPAAAGVGIAAVGLRWVFAADAVSFLAMTAAAWAMSSIPPTTGSDRAGVRSIIDGFKELRGRQIVQGAYLIDLNATVFGLPRALFPALAISVFHGGPATLGALTAAPGAGALVGALTTGWLDRIRRQPVAIIAAVCLWGVSIAAFGLVHVLWIALIFLAVAGWADVVSAVLRTTLMQRAVPDALRGRIAAMQIAVVEGGPRLGDLQSGAVASAISTQFSVVAGGLACVAGAAVIAAALPTFRRSTVEPA